MPSLSFDLLPIEVIEKVFLLCLPENGHTFLPPKKSYYVVQLVISQVSSRWRSIALCTRQLWDNFTLLLDSNLRDRDYLSSSSRRWLHGQREAAGLAFGLTPSWCPCARDSPSAVQVPALQLASLWLHRARGLPITLKVQTDLPHDDPHIHNLCHLISSQRFKSLGGNLKTYWFLLHDKSCEESFTSLDTLHLEFSIRPFQARDSPFSDDDHCQLPSLRYLHLNFKRAPVSRERDLHMIPWRQLSTLTVHNAPNFSTIIDIMRECEALVECKLLKFPANANSISVKTSLPHLRNLELSSRYPIEDLIEVLSTFTMPNLTYIGLFHLIHTNGAGPQMNCLLGTDCLPSQLRVDVQFQQLHEFTFSDPHNLLDVRMFLRHIQFLRRLALHGHILLDHYTANEISTGQLGRYLDTISLRSCRSVTAVGRILDMIEKRQENAKSEEGRNLQPFIHVRLGCPGASGDEYKERVERLERQHDVRIEMDLIHNLAPLVRR